MTAALAREMIDPVLRDSRHPGAAAARDQADWLLYLELGGMAPSSLFTYQWTTDKLLKRHPFKAFSEFTDGDLSFELKQFPAKSRKPRAGAFRSWFQWGVKTRRILENPCDFLPDFKATPQPVVEVFTVEEEAALRALPEPHGTLMAVLFDTGLRKAEARNLTRRRVDFHREQLIVIEGAKGGKQRTVPIDQQTAPFLIGRLDHLFTTEGIDDAEYLWFTRPGGGRVRREKPMGNASFQDWWIAQIGNAGVRYRKAHTTRHTYATRMRQLGVDLGDIQMLLGHSSIVTTQQIYVHQTMDDVRDRIAALRGRV